MAIKVRAVFDGETLRPMGPVGLRENVTYNVVIEDEAEHRTDEQGRDHPLTGLGRMAADMGVDDLAANHDRYAHGRLPDRAEEG